MRNQLVSTAEGVVPITRDAEQYLANLETAQWYNQREILDLAARVQRVCAAPRLGTIHLIGALALLRLRLPCRTYQEVSESLKDRRFLNEASKG